MTDFTVPPELSTPADVQKPFLIALAAGLRDRGLEGIPKGTAALLAASGAPIVPDETGSLLSTEADVNLRGRAVRGGRIDVAAAETATSGTITADEILTYANRLTPYNSGSSGTRTLSGALPSGTVLSFVQVGAGSLQILCAGGLTLRHPLGHTRTAAQWGQPIVLLVLGGDVLMWGGTAP